jgi:hypothetical protein
LGISPDPRDFLGGLRQGAVGALHRGGFGLLGASGLLLSYRRAG